MSACTASASTANLNMVLALWPSALAFSTMGGYMVVNS